MSELLVRVVQIDTIEPHPNADRLEIVKIGGWQIVSGKGNYKVGDLAIHVPPDAMVPKTLADEWGVTQYLSWRANAEKGRVKAVRLRGVASHGFLSPNSLGNEVGENLAETLKIEKYEELVPIGMQAGQIARKHPLFHTYTSIENLRNYPNKLCYDEPLVVIEKTHGTNSRLGWVRTQRENGTAELELAIGTHRTQRKTEDSGVYGLPWEKHQNAFSNILDLFLKKDDIIINSLIFFGEIFGAGVQDLHYGAKSAKDWRLFDIAVNGKYLYYPVLEHLAKEYGLPLMPEIARGYFDFERLVELAQGNTTFADSHIREGVVIRPMIHESTWSQGDLDPHPRRCIFKLINDDYLLRKNKDASEYH